MPSEITTPFVTRHHLVTVFRQNIWEWAVIAIIAVAYLATLTGGHPILGGDYAAYIMHASNLVEGRPYADLHFIPNPEAMWFIPANGYPPVYPLLLAPIYKCFGLNLWAMKLLTVSTFVAFLILFVFFVRPSLRAYMRVLAICLLACHPFFWQWKGMIHAELPYMMFSFAALLLIQYSAANLDPDHWNVREALLLSLLIYCAYGTRTIGITLLASVALAQLFRFRRPGRFLWLVLLFTAIAIALQIRLLNSPKAYVNLTDFSPTGILQRFIYYGKTLSYVWSNGASKGIQIIVALLFTSLALVSFVRRLWTHQSAVEIYVLGYVAVLMVYAPENGWRFLLPILPLYIFYLLEELARLMERVGRHTRIALQGSFVLAVALIYWGHFVQDSRGKPPPDVEDVSFRQLCSFLRNDTQPTDIIAAPNPHTVALFINRTVTVLGPSESPERSLCFLRNVHATILIAPDWAPLSWGEFVVRDSQELTEIYHNLDYKVFRLKP